MTKRDTSRYAARQQQFASTTDFLNSSVAAGLSTIDFNGLPMDILIDPVAGATTTIVSFHPAVTNTNVTRPYFVGTTVFSGINANKVYFSDPSLELSDDLTLAWFAGNSSQPETQQAIVQVLQHVLDGLRAPHAILYGASGGGFAALYYSSQLPTSMAIAVNPQTDILKYYDHHILRYTKPAWNMHSISKAKASLPLRIRSNVIDVYSGGAENSVLYLQNARDEHHVNEHMQPLLESLPESNSFRFLIGDDWGDGHSPAPKEVQINIFESATSANGDWKSFFNTITGLRRSNELFKKG